MKFCYLLPIFFISFSAKCEDYLNLVTGNDYPPYSDERLPEGGIFTAKVKQILNKLNIKYKIEFMPWARGYELVKKGTFSATFPYTFTEERNKEVLYLKKSILSTKIFIYTHIKYKNKKSIDDFNGLVFCAPNGYYIEESIQNKINKEEIKLQKQFDAKSCLISIINSDADFMILGSEHIKKYQEESTEILKKIVPLKNPIKKIELYIVFNKNIDKNIYNKIEKELNK